MEQPNTPRSILKTQSNSQSEERKRVSFAEEPQLLPVPQPFNAPVQTPTPPSNPRYESPHQAQQQYQWPLQQQIIDGKQLQLLTKALSITLTPAQLAHSDGHPQHAISAPPAETPSTTIPQDVPSTSLAGQSFEEALAEELKNQRDVWLEKRVLQAIRLLSNSLLKNCFKSWQTMLQKRWWKFQLEVKDEQLRNLSRQFLHLENRPVMYLSRRRKRYLFEVWKTWTCAKLAQKRKIAKAIQASNLCIFRSTWKRWLKCTYNGKSKRNTLEHGKMVITKKRLSKMIKHWRAAVAAWKAKKAAQSHAVNKADLECVCYAFQAWYKACYTSYLGKEVDINMPYKKSKTVFQRWKSHCQIHRLKNTVINDFRSNKVAKLYEQLFFVWRAVAEARIHKRLYEDVEKLRSENEQLLAENERLARVIDSGEFERERLAHLEAAEEALHREHDVLRDLVARAGGRRSTTTIQSGGRRSSTAALHQDSLRRSTSLAPLDTSQQTPMQRNKMLVKGGSSFNALVRALKQDLLASGAMERDPTVALEIDRLASKPASVSMQPDGQISINASNPSKANVAFGRLKSKQAEKNTATTERLFEGGRSVAVGKRLY